MNTLTTRITQAEEIRQTKPLNALKILKEVLKESINENDHENSVIARFNLAITYLILGNYFDSLNNFFTCLNVLDPVKDKKLKAEILRGIGTNYFRLYDYKEAIKYYYLSEQVSIESSNYQNLHSIYQDFGSLYNRLQLYKKALEYCLISLDIAEQCGIDEAIQTSMMSIGACYYQLGNEEKALMYLNDSLKYSMNPFAEANAYHFISMTKYDAGDLDEAVKIANKQITICRQNNFFEFEALGLRMLGDIDNRNEDYSSALLKYEDAVDLLNKAGEKQIKFTLFKRIIDLNIISGNSENVISLYKKLYEEHTDHLEKNIQLKIEQLDVEYETQKIKKEYEKQKESNSILSKALNDVSRLNNQLHDLHDEKNSLMGIVAHDLKNPIQSILSSAKLINSNKNEPEFVDEMLDNIKDQSKRMVNLINILMDYRAIEEGNIKLKISIFSNREIISKLIKNTEVFAVNKGINIINEAAAEEQYIKTDFLLLYQVLENLVTNAIKFSPEGKNVYLKFEKKDKKFIFRIIDEGPGFSDEDKIKLYSNFAKLSAKPTGNESTTGLGLSIVKKLCNILDADIQLDSKINCGAAFTITLNNC